MNIAQLKADLDNGVMIGRETWKELVIYAHNLEAEVDRLMLEHEPDSMTPEQTERWAKHQRKVQLNKEFGPLDRARIGQPSMLPLGNVGYTVVPAVSVLDVECGDTACVRCTTGAPGFCINDVAPKDLGPARTAPAHPAATPGNQQLIDNWPRGRVESAMRMHNESQAYGKLGSVAAHIAAWTDTRVHPVIVDKPPVLGENPKYEPQDEQDHDYSAESFEHAEVGATMYRRKDGAIFDADAQFIDKRLTRYGFDKGGTVEPQNDGALYSRFEVLALFNVAD